MSARIWAVSVAMALCMLLSGAASRHSTGQENARDDEELIARQYHISPLVRPLPQWNFAALMSMEEGRNARCPECGSCWGTSFSLFVDTSTYRLPLKERLQAIIKDSVRSGEPWNDYGGKARLDIYEQEGLMVVFQTAAGHAAVEGIIDHMIARRTMPLQITVQAVELDAGLREKLAHGASSVARTDDEQARLWAAVTQTFARTTLSMANGQMASSNSGTIQSYVSDLEPIVAENAISYDPTIRRIPNGLAVVMAPEFGEDGIVRIEYAICYARLRAMRQERIAGVVPEMRAEASVELPLCDADQRAGTISIPLGSPAVIGGGTVPKHLVTGREDVAGTVELDYIVTVRRLCD